MIVDIAEVNRNSPYRVYWEENGRSLIFLTENDVEYKVSFMRDDRLFDGLPVSRFSFSSLDRQTGDRRVFDPKIRETVFQILQNFLSRNYQVMIYICDNDDGRQKHRFRLFNTWFLQTNRIFEKKFIVCPVEYSADGISFYAGMVMKSDNPLREQYLDALYQYMKLLYEDK